MRSLLLVFVVFGSLPLILFQPFIGLLVYSWLAYMKPQNLVWSAVPQVSLIVGLATVAGMVLAIGRERWITAGPQTSLLIAFGFWFCLASVEAIDPSLSFVWTIRVVKILFISILTTGLVQTEKRFRWLYLVIAFSLGTLGAKYGIHGLIRGGTRITEGPGGFMIDNNSFAMALNMGIPLLVGVALVESRRWLRAAAWACAVLTAATVIFTFSRGGLIALIVVLAILFARSGRPVVVALVISLALAGLLMVTSAEFEESYSDRASSISSYETDSSLGGRFKEWGTALRIFRDHPILGVGPDNLAIARPLYVPDGSSYLTTHNSFFQLLVACGGPGLLLFVSALGVSLWRLQVIRRASSQHWARTYAGMLQVSFVAFAVGGMLLDMAYLDLVYQLMAMTVSLEIAATGIQKNLSKALSPETRSGEGEWWRNAPA